LFSQGNEREHLVKGYSRLSIHVHCNSIELYDKLISYICYWWKFEKLDICSWQFSNGSVNQSTLPDYNCILV